MMSRSIRNTGLLGFVLVLLTGGAGAQAPSSQPRTIAAEVLLSKFQQQFRQPRRAGFGLMPSNAYARASFTFTQTTAPNNPVLGSGIVGRLTKWTGITGGNSFIGDSTIFEDKFGMVGVGTDTPTSKFTVAGLIQTTSGGVKFPDGTVQTTAGVAPSDVVRSLNGLKGDLLLAGGTNITVSSAGNTITVAAPNALTMVAHDATLIGNGTTAIPVRVAAPLNLMGSVPFSFDFDSGVIVATNTAVGGTGVSARGGSDGNSGGGSGVSTFGGNSEKGAGGIGAEAIGGDSTGGTGGSGVLTFGGNSENNTGGDAVAAAGGDSHSGTGGAGAFTIGGEGSGAGNSGGTGIMAVGGAGFEGAVAGLAGQFDGNVEVTGTLSKGGGSFKIDHPLDPANKYLYHSFVESPDMKNIYDGNVTTDANGEARVDLPDWFEALNRDFRYQLTVIGTFAQAIVAEKIKGNRFVIKTNAPSVEVSWQVTGIRQDAFANKNRIPVEEAKSAIERGYYLHPEAFDRPEEKSINWARRPEIMQQLKQRRVEAQQKRTSKQQ